MAATDPTTPTRQDPSTKCDNSSAACGIAAKRHPERRFHALYDRIWRSDVLREAWKRVRQQQRRCGRRWPDDRGDRAARSRAFLEELPRHAARGKYRPQPVLRRYIPKADGKQRPLGIPTVRDRVVQMAAKLVLEPIFEADFHAVLVRLPAEAKRHDALETIRAGGGQRPDHHVLDADIRDYFGSIDHEQADEARRASASRTGGCSSCCGSGSRQG